MSMLRTIFTKQTHRKYAVIHGARHSWDLGYTAELVTMARLCANVTFLPAVSRPQDEPAPWGGATGYVQQIWTGGALDRAWGRHPTPEDTHVFLCGNPGMIEQMLKTLEGEGFLVHEPKRPGQIHVEKYW